MFAPPNNFCFDVLTSFFGQVFLYHWKNVDIQRIKEKTYLVPFVLKTKPVNFDTFDNYNSNWDNECALYFVQFKCRRITELLQIEQQKINLLFIECYQTQNSSIVT